MDKIRTLILDDEQHWQLVLRRMAEAHPAIEIAGVYGSPAEAIPSINKGDNDLLLLDVQLAEVNGIDFVKGIENPPLVILITTHDRFALKSYEIDAVDFLVKPVRTERFAISMERVQNFFEIKQKADLFEHSLGGNTVFIKDGHEQIKVNLHEIIYLEALKDYTRIVTKTKKHSVLISIGNLLLENAFQSFVRIHRSFAVQPNFIDKYTTQLVYIQDFTLPVGRSYKDVLGNLK